MKIFGGDGAADDLEAWKSQALKAGDCACSLRLELWAMGCSYAVVLVLPSQ